MWRSGDTYEESAKAEQNPGSDEPRGFEAVTGIKGVGAEAHAPARVERDHCGRLGCDEVLLVTSRTGCCEPLLWLCVKVESIDSVL